MSCPVPPPRLTVRIRTLAAKGMHFRELQMTDAEDVPVGEVLGSLGQMSRSDAARLQKSLDEVIAAEREDAVERYRAEKFFEVEHSPERTAYAEKMQALFDAKDY